MTFAWSNLSKNTMRELAKGAGLVMSRAEQELTNRYGPVPTEEFVEDLWTVLRDGWVTREPVAREDIVNGLRAARLGNMSIKVGRRSGQLDYLRSCRPSATLKSVVLQALLKVGSVPYDTPAEQVGKSEEEMELPLVEWLRRACVELSSASLPVVELAVCLAIGRELKGVDVPVSDDSRADLVGAIVTAAIMATHAHADERAVIAGEPPPHHRWVLAGAERIARDRTVREQVVRAFADEVDGILGGGTAGTFNASMTCLSMFFTTLAFGPANEPSVEQSQQLVSGLSYILQLLEPSGDDAPTELRDDDEVPEDSDDQPDSATSLAEFLTGALSPVPGVRGPMADGDITKWMMPAGSALVRVIAVEPDDQLHLIRFSATLLTGITPTGELLGILNVLNAREEYAKFYLEDDRVMLEYDQIVADLSATRVQVSLQIFLKMADQYDNILQDRFGGGTHSVAVKARFNA